MVDFPIKFESKAKAKEGISTPWECQTHDLVPISVSIPIEFNGPGKAYSPEDLYGLAVLNCLIAVFKTFCEKYDVKFESIDGTVNVIMDRNPKGNGLMLTNLDLSFDVKGASDVNKARELLERALKECPVTNSIKSGKTCHLNIS